SVSSDLDTLTPVFELYVWLRERRQWDNDCHTYLLVTCSTLVVGGTDTSSRHWSPASPFPVPHSSEPRPGSLEVLGMGLRPCGLQKFEMADRRDWGGGGDDPEESTQRMIERIWDSLTDIRVWMDQQASVPPVAVPPGNGETVPIAPVLPGVEVPFVAPMPPPPPVILAEEPVMQVEKFLRLQPPTYSGGPNLDTAE
ncbi:hypothetical protein Taro_047834, partial [Colocasia esculenta]|nr:hypothetical protein [Colocasia esculenta]